MENKSTFMRCVYYPGCFPDEYAITFKTLDGQESCFADKEDVVPNGETLRSNGNEGLVKVNLHPMGYDWGIVSIKDEGRPTNFCVSLEQLVVVD